MPYMLSFKGSQASFSPKLPEAESQSFDKRFNQVAQSLRTVARHAKESELEPS